ncbi:MAG: hypothetical protein H0T73_04665 [Ardenticatenales bacterium]|nr:hypothetical protein [Ardenticatenales bacterium]
MQAHRLETKLTEDGTITLSNLPFQAGESVEIIILSSPATLVQQNRYPLRGKAIRYDNPTVPIAQDDWEANE